MVFWLDLGIWSIGWIEGFGCFVVYRTLVVLLDLGLQLFDWIQGFGCLVGYRICLVELGVSVVQLYPGLRLSGCFKDFVCLVGCQDFGCLVESRD